MASSNVYDESEENQMLLLGQSQLRDIQARYSESQNVNVNFDAQSLAHQRFYQQQLAQLAPMPRRSSNIYNPAFDYNATFSENLNSPSVPEEPEGGNENFDDTFSSDKLGKLVDLMPGYPCNGIQN